MFPGIIGIHGTITLKNLENNLGIKRGLINGLGSIFKAITGNLDASDGEKFESLISDLQNNQNKLSEAINSQNTLSVELIDNFNKAINQITHNQKLLEAKINQLSIDMINTQAYIENGIFLRDTISEIINIYHIIISMSSRTKRILAAALETDINTQVLEEALSHSIVFTNEDITENVTNDGLSKGISETGSVLALTLSYDDMNVDIIDALARTTFPNYVMLTYSSLPICFKDDLKGILENLQTSSELLDGEMNAAAGRQDQSVPKDADPDHEMEKENQPDEPDPDFIVTEDENCTAGQEPARQKKPKRKRKPENIHWTREKIKCNRMQGKDYLGYSRSKSGQVLQNSERQCRSLGPACSSMKCLKYVQKQTL
ncbi:unnamed protein product [Acanthoscelides obtectus]|uniref:Uncharacterized protein n=1 Tax=Acanthoscelides obtectus TaxID=200917 RepID=A0A9P0PU23_ACAOB|nr:unnamed protein product [Acanthoscelides obtectus]CAK1657260.1 hypothetical protein AOBTE_LOCUS20253 [Acanthoscelides obtectus]